jgi:hypothetical protein
LSSFVVLHLSVENGQWVIIDSHKPPLKRGQSQSNYGVSDNSPPTPKFFRPTGGFA